MAATPHSNVYVRNISPQVDETSLRTLFEYYGPVDSVKLVSGKVPGGYGHAFINYTTVEAAQNAIAYLNNYAVHGIAIEVKSANAPAGAYARPAASHPVQAIPNDNLYVAHVPLTYTEDRVVSIFQQHGLVLSCKLLTGGSQVHEHKPGYTAMVRMGSVDEATRAIQALNGTLLPEASLPLLVKYADTPEQKALRKSRAVTRPPTARYHPYSTATAPQAAAPVGSYTPPVVQELHFAPQAAAPHMPPAQPQPYAPVQPPHMPPAQPQYMPPANPQYAPPPDPYQQLPPPGAAPPVASYAPPHAGVQNGHQGVPPDIATGSIYIKNLPAEADKLYLYETFAPLGAIKSVKAMLNDESGLCTGVGFVNFAHPEAAQLAVTHFNGAPAGDKVLYVALQPAKPHRNATYY